jgi:hypothetical protein
MHVLLIVVEHILSRQSRQGSCEKMARPLEWEAECPREPLRVRVFLTTGSRGRSPSLFFSQLQGNSENCCLADWPKSFCKPDA